MCRKLAVLIATPQQLHIACKEKSRAEICNAVCRHTYSSGGKRTIEEVLVNSFFELFKQHVAQNIFDSLFSARVVRMTENSVANFRSTIEVFFELC